MLERVLKTYANVDTEISELALMLNEGTPPGWREEFHHDLRAALQDGSLDIDAVHRIMFWRFRSQEALDVWFRRAWAEWFPGEPYPS